MQVEFPKVGLMEVHYQCEIVQDSSKESKHTRPSRYAMPVSKPNAGTRKGCKARLCKLHDFKITSLIVVKSRALLLRNYHNRNV